MISMNKKYQTRDGRPVELVTTNGRGKWPVMGYIGANEFFTAWDLDGSHVGSGVTDSLDLVEARPKRVMWLNVYPDDEVLAHDSREDAEGGER